MECSSAMGSIVCCKGRIISLFSFAELPHGSCSNRNLIGATNECLAWWRNVRGFQKNITIIQKLLRVFTDYNDCLRVLLLVLDTFQSKQYLIPDCSLL